MIGLDCGRSAHARVDPLTWIAGELAQIADTLERERFDEREASDARDGGYRRGWNDHGISTRARLRSLLADLRLRLGLAELRASDVDGLEQRELGGEA